MVFNTQGSLLKNKEINNRRYSDGPCFIYESPFTNDLIDILFIYGGGYVGVGVYMLVHDVLL